MANGRDINLDIVGHDHTGKATRSAGNNFDQLKRKVERVDGVAAKTSVSMFGLSVRLGAMGSRILAVGGPVAAIAALAIGMKLAVVAAAALSGALIVGLGAGLVGIGVMAAAQNEKVRKAFQTTIDYIKSRAPEFGKPFEPVLIRLASRIRQTFDGFAPTIRDSIATIAPAVDRFLGQLQKSIMKLEPTIRPAADAFKRFLDALGPQMPGVFQSLANSIDAVTASVNNNPEAFANMVAGMGKAIAAVVQMIAYLADLKNNARLAWAEITLSVRQAIADMANSLAGLPGPIGKAFQGFATSARQKVGEAQRAVDALKTAKAQGQIQVLQSKINSLKGKVVDAKTSPEAKARAVREIRELQAQINALRGKTVTVTTYYVERGAKSRTAVGPGAGGQGKHDFGLGDSWAPAGAGRSRTGGPMPVTVNAPEVNITNRVEIAGLDALIESKVAAAGRRDAHRARYGRR